MATKHTEHYQLNLWEPEDSFLRTEFNENSAKIDAALAAEKTARETAVAGESAARLTNDLYVKLVDTTTTSAQQQLSVSLSGIDFTAYRHIDVYFQAKVGAYVGVDCYLNSTSMSKEYCPCSAGGSSSYYNGSNTSSMASLRCDQGQTLTAHLDLGIPCAGNHILCRGYFAAHGSDYMDSTTIQCLTATITWSNLRTLIFKSTSASGLILAGARVTVVGLRV